MGSFAAVLDNQQALENQQRQQGIAQNQATSLGIATALRTGVHPDTGEALTPQEKMMLSQKYNELQANTADLFNNGQNPNKMGKNLSTASGVQPPETPLHSLAAKLHIASAQPVNPPKTFTAAAPDVSINGQTLPPAPTTTVQGPPQTPQDVMQGIQDIRKQFMGMPPSDPFFVTYMHAKTMGATPAMLQQMLKEHYTPEAAKLSKPLLKQYKLADGTLAWLDSTHPDDIPEGATALGLQTGVALKRQDYTDYMAAHPGDKRTPEEWAADETRKGRTGNALTFEPNTGMVVNKGTFQRYGRHDPNLPPEVQSIFANQQETAAEKQRNAMALMYARGASIGANRIIQVLDPTNPGAVQYMKAGDAIKTGAQSPAGIAFKVDAAMERALTSGTMGQNIIAFNTAASHLDMLEQAATALQNGDTQFVNRMGNQFQAAMGVPAPTNFAAVKAAVAGEIAKTFKNSVTDTDMNEIKATIDNAQSPEQIYGAINYYRALMRSKVQAVQNMGKGVRQGLSNSLNGGNQTKGTKSLAAAMALPINQGKSAAEVEQHMKELGYTVVRP